MQFSGAFGHCLAGNTQAVVDVVRVSVRLARSSIEAAKLAVDVTDVSWIEMTVDVEVSDFPVSLPSDCVGEFAEPGQIVRRE